MRPNESIEADAGCDGGRIWPQRIILGRTRQGVMMMCAAGSEAGSEPSSGQEEQSRAAGKAVRVQSRAGKGVIECRAGQQRRAVAQDSLECRAGPEGKAVSIAGQG